MEYEKVTDALLELFPGFVYCEESTDLQYCVANDFALYLLKAYRDNSFELLARAGEFIESLYSYEDEKIENLATVGYLEAIQIIWENNDVNPDEMIKYLGEESQKGWKWLLCFWHGELAPKGIKEGF